MNSIQHLIDIALKEDIGSGDITTDNLVSADTEGKGIILAKETLIIAGLDVTRQVFQRIDPKTTFEPILNEGARAKNGDTIAAVEGKLRTLLVAERVALNFLQRLSGIATLVRSYVDELGRTHVRLVDTRKTAPGWRVLEKYAVRIGGADNHRMGLYDGVLIKDNHIAACGGSITHAVERLRDRVSHLVKIEVEVSGLDQVKEALDAAADVIMLDNMNIQQIKDAIDLIDGRATVEVSGGITRRDLKQLVDTGVDIISIGALTHSARCVDISMRVSLL
jgi:nicotinate-nucleotide pyrophosphorylase (carboxylating)